MSLPISLRAPSNSQSLSQSQQPLQLYSNAESNHLHHNQQSVANHKSTFLHNLLDSSPFQSQQQLLSNSFQQQQQQQLQFNLGFSPEIPLASQHHQLSSSNFSELPHAQQQQSNLLLPSGHLAFEPQLQKHFMSSQPSSQTMIPWTNSHPSQHYQQQQQSHHILPKPPPSSAASFHLSQATQQSSSSFLHSLQPPLQQKLYLHMMDNSSPAINPGSTPYHQQQQQLPSARFESDAKGYTAQKQFDLLKEPEEEDEGVEDEEDEDEEEEDDEEDEEEEEEEAEQDNEEGELDENRSMRVFRCSVPKCSEVFDDLQRQRDHLNSMHTLEERQFKCLFQGCRKVFAMPQMLQKHAKNHVEGRQYKCSFEDCGQSFRQLSNLKRHMVVHSNEKPYECDVCNRKFTIYSNMKQHKAVHEKSRQRFTCSVPNCGKSYLYSSSLKKHEKEHLFFSLSSLPQQATQQQQQQQQQQQFSSEVCQIEMFPSQSSIESNHSSQMIMSNSKGSSRNSMNREFQRPQSGLELSKMSGFDNASHSLLNASQGIQQLQEILSSQNLGTSQPLNRSIQWQQDSSGGGGGGSHLFISQQAIIPQQVPSFPVTAAANNNSGKTIVVDEKKRSDTFGVPSTLKPQPKKSRQPPIVNAPEMILLSGFFSQSQIAIKHDDHFDLLFEGRLYYFNKTKKMIEMHEVETIDTVECCKCQPLPETSHHSFEEIQKRINEIEYKLRDDSLMDKVCSALTCKCGSSGIVYNAKSCCDGLGQSEPLSCCTKSVKEKTPVVCEGQVVEKKSSCCSNVKPLQQTATQACCGTAQKKPQQSTMSITAGGGGSCGSSKQKDKPKPSCCSPSIEIVIEKPKCCEEKPPAVAAVASCCKPQIPVAIMTTSSCCKPQATAVAIATASCCGEDSIPPSPLENITKGCCCGNGNSSSSYASQASCCQTKSRDADDSSSQPRVVNITEYLEYMREVKLECTCGCGDDCLSCKGPMKCQMFMNNLGFKVESTDLQQNTSNCGTNSNGGSCCRNNGSPKPPSTATAAGCCGRTSSPTTADTSKRSETNCSSSDGSENSSNCMCRDTKEMKHIHGENCGHPLIFHNGHIDYLVNDQLHHIHEGHCDYHGAVVLLDEATLK